MSGYAEFAFRGRAVAGDQAAEAAYRAKRKKKAAANDPMIWAKRAEIRSDTATRPAYRSLFSLHFSTAPARARLA